MIQKRIPGCLFLGLLIAVANGYSAVEIIGSDLLSEPIREAITGELNQRNIDTQVALRGSLLAREAFDNQEIDACIIAMPDSGEQLPYDRVFPFCFQIVGIAVNANNPLSELAYGQLREIFRSGGNIDNWSMLLKGSDWQDRQINLWGARSRNLIALEIFNAVVLDGSALKGSIRYGEVGGEPLSRALENDESALFILPFMNLGESARFLAIKDDSPSQSYTPSPDNVFYGDYPLRLPFHLVVADSVDPNIVRDLVEALYSGKVTEALLSSNCMPLPELERQAVLSRIR